MLDFSQKYKEAHLDSSMKTSFFARRSYNACSVKAVESKDFQESIVDSLAIKARKEMEYLNSHPSLLKDSPKALEKFTWHSLHYGHS